MTKKMTIGEGSNKALQKSEAVSQGELALPREEAVVYIFCDKRTGTRSLFWSVIRSTQSPNSFLGMIEIWFP